MRPRHRRVGRTGVVADATPAVVRALRRRLASPKALCGMLRLRTSKEVRAARDVKLAVCTCVP
jgi:hypothetical protein